MDTSSKAARVASYVDLQLESAREEYRRALVAQIRYLTEALDRFDAYGNVNPMAGQGSAANDIITYGQQAKDMAEAARMIAYAAEAEGSRTA